MLYLFDESITGRFKFVFSQLCRLSGCARMFALGEEERLLGVSVCKSGTVIISKRAAVEYERTRTK